jgi:hypothetical protein
MAQPPNYESTPDTEPHGRVWITPAQEVERLKKMHPNCVVGGGWHEGGPIWFAPICKNGEIAFASLSWNCGLRPSWAPPPKPEDYRTEEVEDSDNFSEVQFSEMSAAHQFAPTPLSACGLTGADELREFRRLFPTCSVIGGHEEPITVVPRMVIGGTEHMGAVTQYLVSRILCIFSIFHLPQRAPALANDS